MFRQLLECKLKLDILHFVKELSFSYFKLLEVLSFVEFSYFFLLFFFLGLESVLNFSSSNY